MEQNKNYLAISDLIRNLEQQLRHVEEVQLRDLEKSRREIEEHFERCIHALEARQHTLLSQLAKIAGHETSVGDQKTKLVDMLQNCNAMKETGALIYKADRSIAEQIWQGANKLAAPNIKPAKFCSEIEIDLPAFLLESIENFGAITTKSALPNENLNYKAKITRTNGSFLLAPPTTKISSPHSPASEFSSPKSTLAIPLPAPSEKSENKISDPTSRFSPDFSPKRSPRKLTPLPLPTPIHTEHPNPDPVLSIPIPVSPNETEPVNLAPFKIVLIGNSKVGKTCIANRFTRNSFSADYTPSAGIEFVRFFSLSLIFDF
eukprot:Phypoly_transcript_06938.p1 GENE.Phypoly_transcript_06938~~Phypoly_transcript_06938.p1  ORF type:complete len:318 (+),score=57.14 Phypoly_transcript_06938:29-982(+)